MRLFGCQILRRGDTKTPKIALTFDDGPHPVFTPMLLDILERIEGKGTFFTTGRNILDNLSLSEDMVRRGHMIGNHTFDHPHALWSGRGKLHDEIKKTKELIEELSEKPNKIFRPPYGFITPSMLSICRQLELSIVLWNSNSKDYKRDVPEIMVNRVRDKITSGSILLFHECHFNKPSLDYSGTLKALKSVVDIVKLRGLHPVTIGEMFTL
ncbi:MAG: polysaccharide deacetylase family protein [candidate division Zixibacteria bacterium]|nr:polysaccharide deacetylase family protein [candidate division Zixibacteria bacterium]